MDIYEIYDSYGYKLLKILDELRKSDVIIQYNGNDYNEIKTIKHATTLEDADNPNDLYDLYGEPIKFYFLVQENSISVNVFFKEYRVAYTFQEKNNWKVIEVEAFGDSFYGTMAVTSEIKVCRSGICAIGILAHFCSKHGYNKIIRHKDNRYMLQAFFYSLLKNYELDCDMNYKSLVLLIIVDKILDEKFVETLKKEDFLFVFEEL